MELSYGRLACMSYNDIGAKMLKEVSKILYH